MLTRKVLKNNHLAQLMRRSFGGVAHHDDHHDDHGHGDHHDDHHDHHIHKAEPDHKFLAANTNKKFLVFDGLRASHNATFEIDNLYRHHNDLPLSQ